MRPKIGLTSGFRISRSPSGREFPQVVLGSHYCDAIRRAGGQPIIIPPTDDRDVLRKELEGLDGVLLTGGDDVPPDRYGAVSHPATEPLHPRRVASDFSVAEFVDARELPVLAICAGIQLWNVHRGGTLHQHLPDCGLSPPVAHRDGQRQEYVTHPVRLAAGTLIHSIAGADRMLVNSWHHQGIDRLGRDLVATAWADDGLTEAVEDPRRRFCLAVQWHPEGMLDDPRQQRLFAALVQAAARH